MRHTTRSPADIITSLPPRLQDVAAGSWGGHYHDPGAALAALACASILRGCSEDLFVIVAGRAARAARRPGRAPSVARNEALSRRVYCSAARFLADSPPKNVALREDIVEALQRLRFQMDTHRWRGQSAAADRRVLEALYARAYRAGVVTGLNGSIRLLAEETLLSTVTVARALTRLSEANWLTLNASQVGRSRRVTLNTEGAVLQSYGHPTAPRGRVHEAFARLGLRSWHWIVVDVLADAGECSTSVIAEKAGISRQTAYRTLRVLQGRGALCSRKCGRDVLWSVNVDILGDVLDELAGDESVAGVPTRGLRERMRAGHAHQRWVWEERLLSHREIGRRASRKDPRGVRTAYDKREAVLAQRLYDQFVADVTEPVAVGARSRGAVVEFGPVAKKSTLRMAQRSGDDGGVEPAEAMDVFEFLASLG